MTNPSIIHVDDSNFATEIEQSTGIVLVDFGATWCGPCRTLSPVIDQIAEAYADRIKVVKVDMDQAPHAAMRHNIRAVPTLIFFKNGQRADTLVGAVPRPTITKVLDKLLD